MVVMPGLRRLTAVATDVLNNSTTSSEYILFTSGLPPAALLPPGIRRYVWSGQLNTIDISVDDSDGHVTQVEVYNGAVPLGLAKLVATDTYRFDYQRLTAVATARVRAIPG